MSFGKMEEGKSLLYGFVRLELLLKDTKDSLKKAWKGSRVVVISEVVLEEMQINKHLVACKK